MEKEVRNEIQKGIDKGLDALADASGWDRESLRTYILCVSIHAPHAGGNIVVASRPRPHTRFQYMPPRGGQRGWALCLRNFQRNLGGEGLFWQFTTGEDNAGGLQALEMRNR